MSLQSLLCAIAAFLVAVALSMVRAGTWLSFNQNVGDREQMSSIWRQSIADSLQHNSKSLEQDGQLAGLLLLCAERAKRSPVLRRTRHLDEICYVLFRVAGGRQRRGQRDVEDGEKRAQTPTEGEGM